MDGWNFLEQRYGGRERGEEGRERERRSFDDYNKRRVHHGPPAKINERPGRETMETEFQRLKNGEVGGGGPRSPRCNQRGRGAFTLSLSLPCSTGFSKAAGTQLSAKRPDPKGRRRRRRRRRLQTANNVLMKGEGDRSDTLRGVPV